MRANAPSPRDVINLAFVSGTGSERDSHGTGRYRLNNRRGLRSENCRNILRDWSIHVIDVTFTTKNISNCHSSASCRGSAIVALLQSEASARAEARSLCIARTKLFLLVEIDPFENKSVLGRLNFPRQVEPVTRSFSD